jgi:hypothetical protein
MFGRTCNGFESWNHQSANVVSGAEAILNRAKEIQYLTQVTIPTTIAEVQKAQSRQVANQNARDHPIEQTLAEGTTVYIRSLKIQNKLKPDAHGHYTVVGRTALGYYWLGNRLGVKMKQSYPISRLKLVAREPSEQRCEVEK